MSKCKITGKVLAIQLGCQETQLVLADRNGQFLYCTSAPTPAGAVEDGVIRNADAVRLMLKELLQERQFKGVRRAVFVLNTTQVITERVTVPALSEAKLEKLLQANMDMYFPVDMHDYRVVWEVVDTHSRDNNPKEADVQLWAVPAAMLESYYKVANSCGLAVAAVDYFGHSIATAVGASFARKHKAPKEHKKLDWNMELSFGKKKEETAQKEPARSAAAEEHSLETQLHLTLDWDLLSMTFVQNGHAVFQRLIRCGSDPAYQFGEVVMMVEYFRSLEAGRGSVLKGIVSGALAEDRSLVTELADMLGMSLHTLDVDYDFRWVACAGAVRTELDFGNPALNRTNDMQKQLRQQLWQFVLLLGAALILLAIILFTLSARLGWESEVSNLESQVQILKIQAQKTAGFADNYKTYSDIYDEYSDDWDTIFASLQTYNDNLALVLEELEKKLPEEASVTGIEIMEDGLKVDFACETKEVAAYLIMVLRELDYATLVDISDLQGGGNGPATSYGSGEEAPTEGSSNLSSYLNRADVVNTLYALQEKQQLKAFTDSAYYVTPASATLSGTRSDEVMKAAMYELMVNNPVAGSIFANLMADEVNQIGSKPTVLVHMLINDGMKLKEDGVLDGKTRREMAEVLVNQLLTVDSLPDKNGKVKYTANKKMVAAEKLIATDAELQSWYVYYADNAAANVAGDRYPYLDIEKVTDDLMEHGSFKTANEDVNTQLNKLISQDAWAYIEALKNPPTEPPTEEPTEPPTEEPTEPPTEEPTAPPTEEPTEPPVEDPTEDPDEDDEMAQQISDMLSQYINNKGQLTDYPQIAAVFIENYLTTGTSGADKLYPGADEALDNYLDSGAADKQIKELYDAYVKDGDTGIPAVNEVMQEFRETGTLANKKLADAIVRIGGEKDPSGNLNLTDTQIEQMFSDYMKKGDSGRGTTVDGKLFKYLSKGDYGEERVNKVLNNYLEKGYLDARVKYLVNQYDSKKKTDNPKFDELMKKYYSSNPKSTGNARLDTAIDRIRPKPTTGSGTATKPNQQQQQQQQQNNNGTANGPEDTRVMFTAMLGYKNELKFVELIRKGLSAQDKVDKLEVGGE